MGQDLHPVVGKLKQRRDSQIRGNPSLTGKSIGTEGKHLRLLEEGEAAHLWQMEQSQNYTESAYCGPTCPGLGHVFTGVQGGWELEHGD